MPSPLPVEDSGRATLVRVGEALSLGFPVWVASACALALWRPATFLWVSPTAQMIGISFTMLGTYPPWLHPRCTNSGSFVTPLSELSLPCGIDLHGL